MGDVASNTLMEAAEQAGGAIAGTMMTLIIIVGIVLLATLLLLIFFIYEMISINSNTKKTVSAINNLSKQLKNGNASGYIPPTNSGANASDSLRYK